MMAAPTRPYAFRALDRQPALSVVEAEPAETPEEVYARELAELERQIEEVRAAAYEEGRSAGVREGRLLAERDSALQARQTTLLLLSEIAQGVGKIDEELLRMEQDAVGAVSAFMQKLAPALLESALSERCAALLQDAFQQLGDTRKLEICVHENAEASIEALLASVDVPAGVEVAVTNGVHVPPGGVAIRWQHGSVVLEPGEIIEAIAAANRTGGHEPSARTDNDEKEQAE